MGMGRKFDGAGDQIAFTSTAGDIAGRYGAWMCWVKPELTGGADYYLSIQSGIALYRQGTGEITAEWRINGTSILCEGPVVADNAWYHTTTWFDHTANAVKLRIYDVATDVSTTYTSASVTPSTWTLETVNNNLYIGARNNGINYWIGEVSAVKIWKFPSTAEQLTENEINRERRTWWPQNHLEYCVIVAPMGTGSPEIQTGTHFDKSGSISGDPRISQTGPPIMAQVIPTLMRPQSKARHVRL